MNQYDLWRFFGALPPLSPETFRENINKNFSQLKSNLREHPEVAGNASMLTNYAFRFSRYDSLIAMDDKLGFAPISEGALARARSRFYRALVDNPSSPNHQMLSESIVEFKLAARFAESRSEALAGLARIYILQGRTGLAIRNLLYLVVSGPKSGKKAASAVCLFLAERPGTSDKTVRLYLKLARRLLKKVHGDSETHLVLAEIERRLGNPAATEKHLISLVNRGIDSARIRHIQYIIAGLPHETKSQHGFFSEIEKKLEIYQDSCPADPMLFVTRGDLYSISHPEQAQMAWRGALVVDERCAAAWLRLAYAYKNAYQQDYDGPREQWLEAAADACLKAVTLEPLNSKARFLLGFIEYKQGKPLQAINTIQGGLALVTGDADAHRVLAASWWDAAVSPELSKEARKQAAANCLREWQLISSQSRQGNHYDLNGLLKALFLANGINQPENAVESLVQQLSEAISSPEDALDSMELIGVLIDFEAFEPAATLLKRCEEFIPDYPELIALQAATLEKSHPPSAIKLYSRAASLGGLEEGQSVDFLRKAAAVARSAGMDIQAERLLKTAFNQIPSDIPLLEDLTNTLARQNKAVEALGLYKNAIKRSSESKALVGEAAWFARREGLNEEAEQILKTAIKENEENAEIWNQLGIHYMENDHLKDAIDAYRKAVEIAPEESIFRGNLGDALRQAGFWTEAESLLENASEAFSLNAFARLLDERSYAFEDSGSAADDWETAGKKYREAALAASSNADFHHDYAWWLYRERRHEDAIAAYRFAALMDPDDAAHPYGEALCHRELGDEETALAVIDMALKLSPDDAMLIAEKADILGDMEQELEAEELFFRVISLADGESWAWERLALFRERRADEAKTKSVDNHSSGHESRWYRAALRAWKQALSNDPENNKLLARTGAAWLRVGRRDKAEELLESSLVRTAEDAYALNQLGLLEEERSDRLVSKGRHADAKEAAEKALRYFSMAAEDNPQIAAHHANLAAWYFKREKWPEALQNYREAAEREPLNAEYSALSGICAYNIGLFEESLHFLKVALEIDNENAVWQNYLGLCLMASGYQDSALEAFRAACLADPENQEYPANLVMIHETLHHPHIDGPIQ